MLFFNKYKKIKIKNLQKFLFYLKELKKAEINWWKFSRQIGNKTIEDYRNFINKDYNLYVQKFQKELILLKTSEEIKKELKIISEDKYIKKFLEEINQLDRILQYQLNVFQSYINLDKKPTKKEFQTLLNFLKQDYENESKTSHLIKSLISQIKRLDNIISNNNYEKKILEITEIINLEHFSQKFKDLFKEAVRTKNFKIQNKNNETLLYLTCMKGNNDLAFRLIEICPEAVKILDIYNETPLFRVCMGINTELAFRLIEIYPKAVKIQAKDNKTPLFHACERKENFKFIDYVYKNNLFLESDKGMIEKYLDMQSKFFSKKVETILNENG